MKGEELRRPRMQELGIGLKKCSSDQFEILCREDLG